MRAEAVLVSIGLVLAPAALEAQSELQPGLAANLFGVSKAGLEAGVLVKPHGNEVAWWPTATASAGIAGAHVSIGVARPLRQNDFGGPGAEFAVRLQGTLHRTWGSPRYVDANETYAGADLALTLPTLIGFRVGAVRPVSDSSKSMAASAGLIIGWH